MTFQDNFCPGSSAKITPMHTVSDSTPPSSEQATSGGGLSMRSAVCQVIERLEKTLAGEDFACGTPSGFPDLDLLAGGFQPGNLFVVASRPAMGKTTFLLNVVESVGLDFSLPVLVFSLGLDSTRVVERLLFSNARVDSIRLAGPGIASKADLLNIQRAALALANSKIKVDDRSQSIDEICEVASQFHEENGRSLVAIDDVALLTTAFKHPAFSKEDEVGEVLSSLRSLARGLGIVVLVTSNLGTGLPHRTGEPFGAPLLAELLHATQIELYADQIGLLHRSDHHKGCRAGNAELHLARNRSGKTGIVSLTFHQEIPRFDSYSLEKAELREAWDAYDADKPQPAEAPDDQIVS